MVSSLFSAFFSVVHGDAPESKPESGEQQPAEKEESHAEPAEQEIEVVEQPEKEEEEEEEPEDLHPHIREECQNSAKCVALTKHFQHCQEKVQAGHGYKHEDCVEELCKF